MNDRIAQALTKLFDRHRIVFWYDAKQELRDDFEALQLPGIEKLELINNEYGIKYRLLREQPNNKFLLYREGPQPADLDNWLLDVQLAHGEFRTDQAAIWLSELELGIEFADIVEKHPEFFRAAKRREDLKKLLKNDDTVGLVRLKMLAVCTSSEPRIDTITESLLEELAAGRDEKMKLIERCHLDDVLWQQWTRHYGYQSNEPSVRDFCIELFKSCYAMGTDGEINLSSDALVFLKRWKDSRRHQQSFERLSAECADVLGIEQDLSGRDFRVLLELDYFRLIDQKIISDLVRAVETKTVSQGDVQLWVRQRRQGYWYNDFRHPYKAIDYAAAFMQDLGEARLTMESLADGVQQYIHHWHQIDQLYRKFTYHVRMSGQASLMTSLADRIENLYSNNYLLKLGDQFQEFVDDCDGWNALPVVGQHTFFQHWVQPFLDNEVKVCVIISDAMRFEIGNELLSRVRQEDKFSADLEPMLSMLPSYTQLGMAALLPNTDLALADNETGTVLVDGQNAQGTANRQKILSRLLGDRAVVCKSDELMAMKGDESRVLVRDHDVIYVYHNRIDATGDKRETEERVFEAVEESFNDIIRLIKKLTSANASNILVTADHGFIYQNRAIDESDFSGVEAEGDQVLYRDRRFVIGKGLVQKPSLHLFSSGQLGLTGTLEIQIPKSINRLRLRGSGSRFVHGGASLQEVVIPVVKIHKKRLSDIDTVDVDIHRGASTVITSGQLAVNLYQTVPVTDKVQARVLRAGIFNESGDLISDSHELTFDLTSENPRDRELKVRFVLTRKADESNGREVILRLEEKHAGTSHYREYKSLRYTIRRSFTSDFDL